MNALADVKSYLSFWGWTDDGNPGSVKIDADQKVIARHGDAEWIADVDKALATLDRLRHRIRNETPPPVHASDVDPTAGLNPDFAWDGKDE